MSHLQPKHAAWLRSGLSKVLFSGFNLSMEGEMLIRVSTISAPRGGFGPILRPFGAHFWLLGLLWGLFQLISGFWACIWPPQRRNVNTCIYNFRTSIGIWAYFDLLWGLFELISGFCACFWPHTEEHIWHKPLYWRNQNRIAPFISPWTPNPNSLAVSLLHR